MSKRKTTSLAITATRRVGRPKTANITLIQRIQKEFNLNQSYLSLVLGLLIVLIMGVLVFNYLKKNEATLGPAQQTVAENTNVDVKPENLPGKYTVKEGDTLFQIAQTYYQDGYKFSELVKANNITNENVIAVGQVLDIPKMETVSATAWGDKINGDTYTVAEGDWLSTIAGRAYGDILAFDKIAKANNITDPNVISPGMVLKIPR